MHVHILGICGTLMGSIALLAKQQGHQVSGCDSNVYPPMSDQLRQAGIEISSGLIAENIPADVDLVMIGNANLPRGNPAVEYVLDQGIPYTSGAEWLGRYLLTDRWVIAVAGTHGKTTTTSMVAWILEYAGMAPGFLVGGVPSNFKESARLGETPFFVIEADEYDTSYFDRRSKFLHYRPRTVILNNLEYDHADIFPDLAAIQNQFHLLIRTLPASGLIIHPADDDNLEAVFQQGCWTPRLSYGDAAANSETAGLSADLQGELLSADASRFQVSLDKAPVAIVDWAMTGNHNMNNALAAIGAARHVGVTPAIACAALNEFKGVKRRMEVIYESAAQPTPPNIAQRYTSLTVYEDFAHHPTAITSTLAGLRHKVGAAKVLAIIEPGSHTMRKGTHEHTLKASVVNADQVIWFQPANTGWDMAGNLQQQNTQIIDNIDGIVTQALQTVNTPGDWHLVIMSNSGFGGLYAKLLAQLP
ncbi:MAG: UDP-N-acetylmuramate: L-alanyl-gamma-D-glutamyl-meso-diaminopimelate ligase [Candidatus Pseudothioglobus sp.]